MEIGLSEGVRPDDLCLPSFSRDAVEPEQSDGDLIFQVGSDELSVLLSTWAALERAAAPTFEVRWRQLGFSDSFRHPGGRFLDRSILGFIEAISNLQADNRTAQEDHVAIGPEGVPWVRPDRRTASCPVGPRPP